MKHEFEILATKALAGEASPEETARLREMLSSDLRLREDYAAMQTAWHALRGAEPWVEVPFAETSGIPEDRLRNLQEVVRSTLGLAPATANSKPDVAPESSEGAFKWIRLWRWWHTCTGVHPLAVSVIVLLAIF